MQRGCGCDHTTAQQGAVTGDRVLVDMLTSIVSAALVTLVVSRRLHVLASHSSFSHHITHDVADHSTCVRTEQVLRAGRHTWPTDDDSRQMLTSTTNRQTDVTTDTQTGRQT